MKFIMQSVKFDKLTKLLENYSRYYIKSVFIRVRLSYYIAQYLEVLISIAK